jgi:hypothetical protein
MNRPLALASFALVGLLIGCGPSAEEKALVTERVALLEMQHDAIISANKECNAVKQKLADFEKANKERVDKFRTAWTALPEDRRTKAQDAGPFPKKEISDERIAVIVYCGGVKLPVP